MRRRGSGVRPEARLEEGVVAERREKVSLEGRQVGKEWLSDSLCGGALRVPYKFVTKCGDSSEGLKDCLRLGSQ